MALGVSMQIDISMEMSTNQKETSFQVPLASGVDENYGLEGEKLVLERILIRESDTEVIRLAFWKDGKLVNRPAYSNAGIDWECLFESAVWNGVFRFDELVGMMKIISSRIDELVNRNQPIG